MSLTYSIFLLNLNQKINNLWKKNAVNYFFPTNQRSHHISYRIDLIHHSFYKKILQKPPPVYDIVGDFESWKK